MHTRTDTRMQLKAAARPGARRDVALPCAILVKPVADQPAGAGRISPFEGATL